MRERSVLSCFVAFLLLSCSALSAEEQVFYLSEGELRSQGIAGPVDIHYGASNDNRVHLLLGQPEDPAMAFTLDDYWMNPALPNGNSHNPYLLITRQKATKFKEYPDHRSIRLNNELFLLEPEGAHRKVGHGVRSATFSPNGSYLGYVKTLPDRWEGFNQTGPFFIETLTGRRVESLPDVKDYAWAPDEKLIAFTRISPGAPFWGHPNEKLFPAKEHDLWIYDMEDKKAVLITDTIGKVERIAGFHPSGQWLIFVRVEAGTPTLWKLDLNTLKTMPLFTFDDLVNYSRPNRSFLWNPNGKSCAYDSLHAGSCLITFDEGERVKSVTRVASGTVLAWLNKGEVLITIVTRPGLPANTFDESSHIIITRVPQ